MLPTDDNEKYEYEDLEIDFHSFPQYLLNTMHKDSITPFYDVLEDDKILELPLRDREGLIQMERAKTGTDNGPAQARVRH